MKSEKKRALKIVTVVGLIATGISGVIGFFTFSGIADELVVSEEEQQYLEAKRDVEHDKMKAKEDKRYWEQQAWIYEQELLDIEDSEVTRALLPTEARKKARLIKSLEMAEEGITDAEDAMSRTNGDEDGE